MKKVIRFLFYLFTPLLMGGLVSFFIRNAIDYTSLVQPPLSPPKILFPIAWTILYLLIGLAYALYKRKNKDFTNTDILYYLQLLVNGMWSIIFFLLKWRFMAILWIICLIVLVIILIRQFYHQNKTSAYLLIPYLLWILFACYLNIGIYLLN